MKQTMIWFAAALAMISCESRPDAPVSMVTETKTASLAQVEMLAAEIRMGAGELDVNGGGAREARAVLEYNKALTEPRFTFDNSSFRARVRLEQKDQSISLSGGNKNRWRLTLPDDVTTELDIQIGAGEARLKLGTLDLKRVNLKLGAGEVKADFRGTPKRDYEVDIQGGVGECEVLLPKSAGVRAEASGGLGSIDVSGLEKRGDAWESEAFEAAKTKVRLRVKGGVGEIRIRVE
jgi:hypothetical protein